MRWYSCWFYGAGASLTIYQQIIASRLVFSQVVFIQVGLGVLGYDMVQNQDLHVSVGFGDPLKRLTSNHLGRIDELYHLVVIRVHHEPTKKTANGAYNKKGTWSVYKVFQHVMKEQTCVFVEDVYDMYGFQLGILERRCRQKMWRNTFGHGFSGAGWSGRTMNFMLPKDLKLYYGRHQNFLYIKQ